MAPWAKCFLFGGLLLAWALFFHTALATELQNASLAKVFKQVQAQTGIPGTLLAAVAARESSFHPWSINLAGQGVYPSSKQAALQRVRSSEARSFDLGLMQINSTWLSRLGITAKQVLEPRHNVLLGALILRDCITSHGVRGGLACYHSGEAQSQQGLVYAMGVLDICKRLEKPQ